MEAFRLRNHLSHISSPSVLAQKSGRPSTLNRGNLSFTSLGYVDSGGLHKEDVKERNVRCTWMMEWGIPPTLPLTPLISLAAWTFSASLLSSVRASSWHFWAVEFWSHPYLDKRHISLFAMFIDAQRRSSREVRVAESGREPKWEKVLWWFILSMIYFWWAWVRRRFEDDETGQLITLLFFSLHREEANDKISVCVVSISRPSLARPLKDFPPTGVSLFSRQQAYV